MERCAEKPRAHSGEAGRGFVLLAAGLVACGGASRVGPVSPADQPTGNVSHLAAAAPTPPAPEPLELEGDGASPETAVRACGETRSDYDFVARYRCPDGSMPLGGDRMRGGGARIGNVGAGPDGHILDLYEVPCADGPVRLYVDMYHCGEGWADRGHLSPEQLLEVARDIRLVQSLPQGQAVLLADLRRWVETTDQVVVTVCPSLLPMIAPDSTGDPAFFAAQYALGMAGRRIERPDTDEREVQLAGVESAVRMYEVSRDFSLVSPNPDLDALLEASRRGALDAVVGAAVDACIASSTAL